MTKQIITIIIILSGIALSPAAEAATDVNLAPVAEPSTSHVSRDTSLAALHDGHAPKASQTEQPQKKNRFRCSSGHTGSSEEHAALQFDGDSSAAEALVWHSRIHEAAAP